MYIEAVAIVIGISQHKMYAVVLVNVVRERDREREREGGRRGGMWWLTVYYESTGFFIS